MFLLPQVYRSIETAVGEHAYYPELSTTAYVGNLTIDEEIAKAGQFATEDASGHFRAFTPIEQNRRIEWGGSTYQVQTVKKQRHKDHILWVEVLARKVVD